MNAAEERHEAQCCQACRYGAAAGGRGRGAKTRAAGNIILRLYYLRQSLPYMVCPHFLAAGASPLASLSWSPTFLIGHAEIDHQHESLLAGLTQVVAAIRGRQPDQRELFDRWLHDFARHAHAEENLMAALSSPAGQAHAQLHAAEHAAFLHEAMGVRAALLAGGGSAEGVIAVGVRLICVDIVGLDFEMIGHLLREGAIRPAPLAG